jgi:hypothetical protein
MSKEIKTLISFLTTKIPESYGFIAEFYHVEGSTNINFAQKFPKKSRRRKHFLTKFMRPSFS